MESSNFTTGKVRLSYANIFHPAAAEKPGKKAKYKCMLIIQKSDSHTVDGIKKLINAHIEAAKKTNGGKLPNGFKKGLRDGDLEREDDENLKDCYFLNCSTTRAPGIVDKNGFPITDETAVYSGCYVRANINVYSFNVKEDGVNSQGVGFGLNHIQFWSNGEPLGGGAGVSTADAFATPIEDEEGADDWL